ncbi:hypothetical protein EI555_006888, partial [Monodon monoceros]
LSTISAEEETHAGNNQLLKTNSKGTFAKEVAVKIIGKRQQDSSSLQGLSHKVKFMKALNHPNTVRLFEVMEAEDKTPCHGICYWKRAPKKEIQVKLCQIESAIKYQHQKFIILDADMTTKIADFGFCIKFTFSNKLDTVCGSPLLCCPGTFPGPKQERYFRVNHGGFMNESQHNLQCVPAASSSTQNFSTDAGTPDGTNFLHSLSKGNSLHTGQYIWDQQIFAPMCARRNLHKPVSKQHMEILKAREAKPHTALYMEYEDHKLHGVL